MTLTHAQPTNPAPIVPTSRRIAQPDDRVRWHTARRHPPPSDSNAPAHSSPSAIASESSTLQRPITAAEIHSLLERAAQPLPPARDQPGTAAEVLEHVHNGLLDRLRDIHEESVRSERPRLARGSTGVDPPAQPMQMVDVPVRNARSRSRGLPPTNGGPRLQQVAPMVVRSATPSPASTVMPDLAPATSPPDTSRIAQPPGAAAQEGALISEGWGRAVTSASPAESDRTRTELVVPPRTNIIFVTDSAAPAQHARLTPDETLHIAFTDAPPPWHRSNARTQIRDRDPSLTYRGMTVASRIGTTSPAPLPNPDSDESSFLSSFPFLRERQEPPPDPVSPRTRPNQANERGMRSSQLQLTIEVDRLREQILDEERLSERYASEALRLSDRNRIARERESLRTELVRLTRERENLAVERDRLIRERDSRVEATSSSIVARAIGSERTSPRAEEVRRSNRAEADRLRALAQDIVRTRPGQAAEVDTPLSMRQLDARVSIDRSRARMRELAGLRRDIEEVRAGPPDQRGETREGDGESNIVEVTDIPLAENEASRRVSETETAFEGAGERREGAAGQHEEREGQFTSSDFNHD